MSNSKYTLLYHPGIPGRGEYIRLAFEVTGTSYNDPANESKEGANQVYSLLGDKVLQDEAANPPAFAPPILRVNGAGKNGKDLTISQTPNILLYLGDKIGLGGKDEFDKYHIHSLALTALDIGNEAHETHHPVAVGQYYDDQKVEARRRATDFRSNRLPKFFDFFQRVLKGNRAVPGVEGRFLVGDQLSYADLALWQVLDGLYYAFPKELAYLKDKYPLLLETFYDAVREIGGIKEYLASGRRLKYSTGIFRHYPELDREG